MSVKTDERTLDIIYQNTSDRPKLVTVAVECFRSNSIDAEAMLKTLVGESKKGLFSVGEIGLARTRPRTEENIVASITFVVKNGWFYGTEVSTVGGSVVRLRNWVEVEI